MGADVHAFGVNNLKWTDDSRKIGYCPKELKGKKNKQQIDDALKLFSVEANTKKKLRIIASAIEIPFTKALSESFGSVWIGQKFSKIRTIASDNQRKKTAWKEDCVQINKHKCNIDETGDAW